jgi:putative ATP-binding cassette transporter
MMQTASAFGNVQSALSFFVSAYRTLAEWRSVVARLDGFEMSIASATRLATVADAIDVVPSSADGIDLRELLVRLPNGTPLVAANGFSFHSHERTLVVGPSGAGKSTLFRAIAGIWPFGTGSIAIPTDATLMMLPQRPYFPIGSLQAATVYPAEATAYGPDQVRDALLAVGLPRLAPQLEQDAHWNRMLSLGEQQRLGIARALLLKPQYLFLDEATASLDIPSERLVQEALQTLLADRTAVIIAHRLSTVAIADRVLVMEHGVIVEDGTPADLIAGTGRFSRLHAAWRESLV